jgi:hypothetical protein
MEAPQTSGEYLGKMVREADSIDHFADGLYNHRELLTRRLERCGGGDMSRAGLG